MNRNLNPNPNGMNIIVVLRIKGPRRANNMVTRAVKLTSRRVSKSTSQRIVSQ